MSKLNRILFIVTIIVSFLGAFLASTYITRLKLEKERSEESLSKYKQRCDRIDGITHILSAYPIHGIEPYVYACAVDSAARKYGIDWEAIVATIDIETGRVWDPTQTSSANCKGLMQFKEATTKTVCSELEIPYKAAVTVWSEIKMIDIGSAYLAKGIKNYGYEEGFKYYVGGSGFRGTEKAAKSRGSRSKRAYDRAVRNANYIDYYNDLVGREYRKLKMMSKGLGVFNE